MCSQWLYASSSIQSVNGYIHPVIYMQSVAIRIQYHTSSQWLYASSSIQAVSGYIHPLNIYAVSGYMHPNQGVFPAI